MSSFFPRGPHNTQLRNWKILAAPSIKISNFIMNFVKTVELFIRIKSRIVLISRVVSLGYRIVRLYALKRIEARLREWERWRQRRQKEPDIREFLAVLKSIPMEKKTCQDHVVHWELKRGERADIERLINLSCYRGIRHQDGLPLHGQRTHTNARTCRSRKQIRK